MVVCRLPIMRDYLKEVDLNPPAATGGPITNPFDPRAHHDFCFLSDTQEIFLAQPNPFPTSPIRVLLSFDCGHQALLNQPFPPPGQGPEVHGLLVIDPATGGMGQRQAYRRDCCHNRRSVKVWMEQGTIPQGPVIVVVQASAKAGTCADDKGCC